MTAAQTKYSWKSAKACGTLAVRRDLRRVVIRFGATLVLDGDRLVDAGACEPSLGGTPDHRDGPGWAAGRALNVGGRMVTGTGVGEGPNEGVVLFERHGRALLVDDAEAVARLTKDGAEADKAAEGAYLDAGRQVAVGVGTDGLTHSGRRSNPAEGSG